MKLYKFDVSPFQYGKTTGTGHKVEATDFQAAISDVLENYPEGSVEAIHIYKVGEVKPPSKPLSEWSDNELMGEITRRDLEDTCQFEYGPLAGFLHSICGIKRVNHAGQPHPFVPKGDYVRKGDANR